MASKNVSIQVELIQINNFRKLFAKLIQETEQIPFYKICAAGMNPIYRDFPLKTQSIINIISN